VKENEWQTRTIGVGTMAQVEGEGSFRVTVFDAESARTARHDTGNRGVDPLAKGAAPPTHRS